MSNRVYIVTYHVSVGDEVVVGVFSTEASANQAIKQLAPADPDNYSIGEWELDSPIER